MSCPQKDVDLFARRAAGRLTAAEAAALDAHLGTCAECRAAADAHGAIWRALDEWPAAPVSGDFDQRLYARIAAESEQTWWKRLAAAMRHLTWKPAISVAAACAAIFLVFLLQGPLMDRGFVGPSSAQVSRQKPVDIDQVESALDDVDMLNQLGGAVPAQTRGQSGT